MKKFTLKISALILFMVVGTMVMAQLPAAISITPENPTANDEITLTLDAMQSCPAEALYGAGMVMMHSGVTLDGASWSNVVAFDGMGANGQYPELVPVMGGLSMAISMTPRYAMATDTVTITLDARASCPEGALYDADSIMMHSGVTLDGTSWSNVVSFDGMGANGQYPKLVSNGDSTWSITIVPAEFYGVTAGEVTAINAVFNAGDWSAGEGKDFDDEGSCIDFTLPLVTEYAHTWSITFTPAEFYGVTEGVVSAINCVFNAGGWDLGEGKDFDTDMNCVDFTIPLAFSAVGDNNEIAFKMYPNPAGNALTVDNLQGANRIEVYNVIGEQVILINDISTEKVTLNTSELNSGVYMINVHNNGSVQSTKFLKK